MNSSNSTNSETRSGRMSPASSRPRTTPSDVSWAHLSEALNPSFRAPSLQTGNPTGTGSGTESSENTASHGLVSVWSLAPEDASRGLLKTLNISEWPSDAAVCSLSEILETAPIPQRFFLSAKACRGILRRAEKRGKTLPTQLLLALRAVAGASNEPEIPEGKTP